MVGHLLGDLELAAIAQVLGSPTGGVLLTFGNVSCWHTGIGAPLLCNRTVITRMSTSTDLKARVILEGLTDALQGAAVDYQVFDGTHHFIISRHSMTHRVVFAERVLEDTEIADLESLLPRITRKLLSERGPCRIRVGLHGGAQRAAA